MGLAKDQEPNQELLLLLATAVVDKASNLCSKARLKFNKSAEFAVVKEKLSAIHVLHVMEEELCRNQSRRV